MDALAEVAGAEGQRLAARIRSRLRGRAARRAATKRRAVLEALEEQGFEPLPTESGTIVLRNCPFHRLARQHTELICGMNLCLLGSAVDEVSGIDLEASTRARGGSLLREAHPVVDDSSLLGSGEDATHGSLLGLVLLLDGPILGLVERRSDVSPELT